jgi:hypothetical protein
VSSVYWENLVVAATDPATVGRFWGAALGAATVLERPETHQVRLGIADDAVLDLCVDRVRTEPEEPLRLHLDLAGGAQQDEVVQRLLGLGAAHLDIGQGDVPWVVLADPGGMPFCVMEHRDAYAGSGPLAALPLDSADPDRDVALWAWLTGWQPVAGVAPHSLRHPSGRGPLLELCPELVPAAGRNRVHPDFRLERDDDPDEVALGILARGGRELPPEPGLVRRQVFVDGSGNQFCVLPAHP